MVMSSFPPPPPPQRASKRAERRKAREAAAREGRTLTPDPDEGDPNETIGEMQRRGAFDVHMSDDFPELDVNPDAPGNLE